MGQFIELTAKDGHKFQAYRSEPAGKPRGAVVVIQEIFGVNHHIKSVTDRYASMGFLAIAPAVFDRYQRGFDVGYTPDDIAKARQFLSGLSWDNAIADADAARANVATAGKVGIVGYCFGGSLSWLASCRLKLDAASGYYGGAVGQFKDETPKCPVIMHFGKEDASIPMATVDAFKAAQPKVPTYVYEGAGHGFSCDERPSFNPPAHDLALVRTYELFSKSIG